MILSRFVKRAVPPFGSPALPYWYEASWCNIGHSVCLRGAGARARGTADLRPGRSGRSRGFRCWLSSGTRIGHGRSTLDGHPKSRARCDGCPLKRIRPTQNRQRGFHFKQCVEFNACVVTQIPAAGGLTSAEQSLVDHVSRGKLLDLAANDEAVDGATMRSWGGSRTCRATVIRDILRGRLAADPDPHGLRLRGARITGRLDLANLTTNVHFELIDCLLEEGVLARDARLFSLVLTGCQLEHSAEPPLDAARLTSSVLSLARAVIIGHAEAGAVNLLGAHIGGSLDCTKASLRSDSGPALNAHNLQVGQDLLLLGGFAAVGAGEVAVILVAAHIGGQLEGEGASLRNDSGAALIADSLQVDQGMFLTRGFSAAGAGELGAVNLRGAHIGSGLECDGASLRNGSGAALIADSLQVDQDMSLAGGFTAIGGGDGVAVQLTGARVGGTFVFDPARLEHSADARGRLAVDGLIYAGVPERISTRDWLRLLRDGTRGYAAQPYQQLAAGHRALGHEREARGILMAQRDDQLARTHTRWPEGLWGRITKVTLGYGYQPWRALLFLTGVVVLSCVLAVVLGSHGALAQTGKTAAPGRSCTLLQQAGVGLDLNLPVGTSVARDRCDLVKDSTSVTASWLTAGGWVLQLLAWAFAALFFAGFTSAVRKT